MKPGVMRFRGYPIERLIGNISFPQMIWLMLLGDLPSPEQGALLEAALVAAVDHGPHVPSIAIGRMAVMPIFDAHHHLWDRPGWRYPFDELLADIHASDHRIVGTAFMQYQAIYRAGGPPSLRPVGETEFAKGVAAMAASGRNGETRVCAAIIAMQTLAWATRSRRYCTLTSVQAAEGSAASAIVRRGMPTAV
jgi:Citrate synthase, C-terminal domain